MGYVASRSQGQTEAPAGKGAFAGAAAAKPETRTVLLVTPCPIHQLCLGVFSSTGTDPKSPIEDMWITRGEILA